MIKESITLDHVLGVLNRALREDPKAMTLLCDSRIVCNEALADDETIQVVFEAGVTCVGLIGILNGLFGADSDGWGAIAAVYDVVCPNTECSADTLDQMEGEACPGCGAALLTGGISGFVDNGRR